MGRCRYTVAVARVPSISRITVVSVRFIVILERNLFYETKNDMGQDREIPELIVN
jgi:hypothetical protein